MALPIGAITSAGASAGAPVAGGVSRSEGNGFARLLDAASASESEALDQAKRFAGGDTSVGIHEVMISSEKAAVQIRFAATLKNKIIEAYRDLMNTQV